MKKLAATALAAASIVACSAHHDHEHASPNLTVTISGEGAALTGFPFPAASPNEPAFVDGWDVRFERILVTVDNIVLTDNPDMSPTDQSVTGPVLKRARGPWAVDMTKPGTPTDIHPEARPLALSPQGADHDHGHDHGGLAKNPNAQPLVRIDGLDGSRSFDPSIRYGFGFDIVGASADAKKTNLDASADADYAEMVQKGWAVLYVGTATFKGTSCTSDDASYDFSKLPQTVKFRFGFATPTQYVNCQNSDLRGKAFDGEEAQRGVQIGDEGGTVAQITLHVDHPFWNTVDHDAPELFFDQMAMAANADGVVTLDDLAKLDFTSFQDKDGKALPWRSCVASKAPKSGGRSFDHGSVPVSRTASPDAALRHYADYVSYQQSTEGHLNAAGLCAVKRLFPAPR